MKSHCWNAFVSQIKPVQAKAAWSRAAGIVSSPWQGRQARRKEGRREASMSAALKAFGLLSLDKFWSPFSPLSFSFSFSPHSAAASPREGSQ